MIYRTMTLFCGLLIACAATVSNASGETVLALGGGVNADWRLQVNGNLDFGDSGWSSAIASNAGVLAGDRDATSEFAVLWGFEVDSGFAADLANGDSVRLDFEVDTVSGTPDMDVALLNFTNTAQGSAEARQAAAASGSFTIGTAANTVGAQSFVFDPASIATSFADGDTIWIGFQNRRPLADPGPFDRLFLIESTPTLTTVTAVPEPASSALLFAAVAGYSGIALRRRKRRRRQPLGT